MTVLEVVGSEPEAVLVCSILRDAGIPCAHRVTNLGSGAMDGLTIGGPREILVHRDQLRLAHRVIDGQRNGPPLPSGRSDDVDAAPPIAAAPAIGSTETADGEPSGSLVARG